MGDKDNEFFGNPMLFIGTPLGDMKPLGKVVEDSTSLNPEDVAELDRLSVREKIQSEPLHIKPVSFEYKAPNWDIAPILGFDEALEPHRCSLVIQGKPIINKPRNLKYPNKKRARRIWNKWANRYGTTPSKMIFIPNVEIDCNLGEIHVTAKPINQE